MRVLFTTRGSAGHLMPLVPVARACLHAGHEVLVVAQEQHRGNVDRAGLPCATVDNPDEARWAPLMARLPHASLDEANDVMLAEFFADIDTEAALPGLGRIVRDWGPDVVVRESWEFASTLVAARHGVPIVRAALGLGDMERLTLRLAAPALDRAGRALGLPEDPAGERLLAGPCLSSIPATLDDPEGLGTVHRLAYDAPRDVQRTEDPGPAGEGPLVYVSLGTVTAAAHLPFYPALYRSVIDALAPLGARVLVTVGEDASPEALGPLPANVRVERWVAQDAVLPHAAAMVCHGGHGSTFGALAHGVPVVVLPLFSIDQWANAAAVARAGAGLALDGDRATRRAVDLPPRDVLGGLPAAVQRVLGERGLRERAAGVAREMAAMAPVDDAVGILERAAAAAAR